MATLTISITIPDDQAARIKNSFCAALGWTATITDIDTGEVTQNPLTQNQFIRRQIADYIKRTVRAYEANQGAEEAMAIAIQAVNSIVIE